RAVHLGHPKTGAATLADSGRTGPPGAGRARLLVGALGGPAAERHQGGAPAAARQAAGAYRPTGSALWGGATALSQERPQNAQRALVGGLGTREPAPGRSGKGRMDAADHAAGREFRRGLRKTGLVYQALGH